MTLNFLGQRDLNVDGREIRVYRVSMWKCEGGKMGWTEWDMRKAKGDHMGLHYNTGGAI